MKKNILWSIIGVAIILLLVIAAFIVKQTTGSGNKDSNGYDTYTVKKETPISLEGKASRNRSKHITTIVKLAHSRVQPLMTVKSQTGDRLLVMIRTIVSVNNSQTKWIKHNNK